MHELLAQVFPQRGVVCCKMLHILCGELGFICSHPLGQQHQSYSDSKKPSQLIKKVGSVLETSEKPLEPAVERRMLHKLINIMDNIAHSLSNIVMKLSVFSLRRLLQLCCNKEWYRRSLLPTNTF